MYHLRKVGLAIAFLASLTVTAQAMAQTQTPRHDQAQIECLAQNVYFEAGNQPVKGQIAVTNVVMNRIAHGFAKTPCGVVMQRTKRVCQFSWTCKKPKIHDWNLYERSRKVAQDVYYARVQDVTRGAIYYHANYVHPNWNMVRVVSIGAHIFYRPRSVNT
jgi:spore germination cell wall hydrolase CwlJ-like protein